MDFGEQEERELWGYKFKATAQEDREIRKQINDHPLNAVWRILNIKVQFGKFDPFTSMGERLCEELAAVERQLETIALALIEEHEGEN